MKTITLTIQVPDGVDVQIATTPAQTQAAAPGIAVPGGASPLCPKHGAEKVKPSRFGGVYCTAQDDSEEKGYCAWKAK